MKAIIKIVIVVSLVWFLCGKLFDYIEYRKLQDKNPFIHKGCRLAFYDKMEGQPCQICLERYKNVSVEKTRVLLKKWERIKGKPFDPSDTNQLIEMVQIMNNHKVCDYLEKSEK